MHYSCLNPEQTFNTIGPTIGVMIALFVLGLITVAITIKAIIFCMIFAKAGYHWALGLLTLIPIACIIMFFVLAFGKWPVRKELEQLRREVKKESA
ncbi:MAG: hypothetical protein MUP16_04355 [Sedimentisphaerales bacterium]|nr:hypothetical protein [Sedimentisphaerales bacterium]